MIVVINRITTVTTTVTFTEKELSTVQQGVIALLTAKSRNYSNYNYFIKEHAEEIAIVEALSPNDCDRLDRQLEHIRKTMTVCETK